MTRTETKAEPALIELLNKCEENTDDAISEMKQSIMKTNSSGINSLYRFEFEQSDIANSIKIQYLMETILERFRYRGVEVSKFRLCIKESPRYVDLQLWLEIEKMIPEHQSYFGKRENQSLQQKENLQELSFMNYNFYKKISELLTSINLPVQATAGYILSNPYLFDEVVSVKYIPARMNSNDRRADQNNHPENLA